MVQTVGQHESQSPSLADPAIGGLAWGGWSRRWTSGGEEGVEEEEGERKGKGPAEGGGGGVGDAGVPEFVPRKFHVEGTLAGMGSAETGTEAEMETCFEVSLSPPPPIYPSHPPN